MCTRDGLEILSVVRDRACALRTLSGASVCTSLYQRRNYFYMDTYIPYSESSNTLAHGSARGALAPTASARQPPNTAGDLMATSAVPISKLFPIAPWAINSGRTAAFHKWWSGVLQLLAALGLREEQIHEPPVVVPTLEDLLIVCGSAPHARARAVQQRGALHQHIDQPG